jgi:carbonic anhydrase
MTKLFHIVAGAVMVSTTTYLTLVQADGAAKYSYHSEDDLGPANWADVDVEDNQCGGDTQSPIAIDSRSCDMYANYRFIVSSNK